MALSKRARVAGISLATAAVVGAGAVAAFSAGASSDATGTVTAAFAKTQDWTSGFQAQYTVTNDSASTVHGWTVSFDLPAGETISSLWNGTMTVAGQHVSVANPAWAADIAPGGTTSFGFVADVTGAEIDPSNCLLNGAPCSGLPGGSTGTPSGAPSTSTPPSTDPSTPPTPTSPATTASAPSGSATSPSTNPSTTKPPTTPPPTTPSPTLPPTTLPPVVGGSYAFAPYVDTGQRQDLGALAKAAGAKYVTAAFVLSNNSCTPVWNGAADATFTSNLKAGLASLRADGGDAIASFGGANGTELGQACTDVASLKAAYRAVIDTYGFSHVDFDIEGGATTDTASITRRDQALAQLQSDYAAQGRTLSISYTLPVLPQGLTPDGTAIVADAARNGVKVDVVNLMAMDYGDWAAPSPAGKMGDYADQSVQSTHDQLKTIYPTLSDAQLWKMIGVTPMIGVNDTQGETFTVTDAQVVASFAAQHHIGRVAMWSLTRDKQCTAGALTWADPSCSSVVQSAYAFSHAFEAFSG